jgi:N6-adenosine-specific RNA methylase IME4
MSSLAFHPLAEIFPLIEGEEFDSLVEDIKRYGVREPVVVYEDKILDGRNRYRACRQGDNQHTEGLPIGRSSELLNVGERSVARAREILDHGVPELQHAVERGDISVAAAADVASRPLEEQHQIVARGEREILEAAKAIRAKNMEERRSERIARLAAISNCDASLPLDRKYPVILADPPWKFEVYDAESGLDSAAEAHYPCMATEEIAALPVGDLATRPAVLFLWSTVPHLPEVLGVIEAWDFQYVTNAVWVKDRAGLGFWVRNQHELLIIARRGDMPTPAFENRPPSVIQAARREHSRKPDEAYELIERMYPDLPRIELFARSRRTGWNVWGNEAPPHPLDIPPYLRRAAP